MLSIQIHGCKTVRAKAERSANTSWVDLQFVNGGYSQTDDICIFFVSADQAYRFAKAINEAMMGESEPLHSINSDVPF